MARGRQVVRLNAEGQVTPDLFGEFGLHLVPHNGVLG